MMENTIQHNLIELQAPGNEVITGDLYYPADYGAYPFILVLHGWKGFRSWGFFPYICRQMARKAIVLCCNVSLNGYHYSDDRAEFPEKFAANTLTREASDISLIVRNILDTTLALKSSVWQDKWNKQLFLLGHSRGGGMAVLTAAAYPQQIQKVALWASIANFDRFSARQKQEWRQKGIFPVENTRNGQMLGMNLDFLQDLEENADDLSITGKIAGLHQQLLILHGAQDMTVLPREAEKLEKAAISATTKHLHIVPGTGHTFGAVHPFQGTNPALEQALQITHDFFFG
jgi:dienelactone hydrolase